MMVLNMTLLMCDSLLNTYSFTHSNELLDCWILREISKESESNDAVGDGKNSFESH